MSGASAAAPKTPFSQPPTPLRGRSRTDRGALQARGHEPDQRGAADGRHERLREADLERVASTRSALALPIHGGQFQTDVAG